MDKKLIHTFSVSHIENGSPTQYKVEIDGKSIKAKGYTISHYVGELPGVSVDMLCELDTHFDECYVTLGGIDAIASIISKGQLLSLVRMYNEHNPDCQVEVNSRKIKRGGIHERD